MYLLDWRVSDKIKYNKNTQWILVSTIHNWRITTANYHFSVYVIRDWQPLTLFPFLYYNVFCLIHHAILVTYFPVDLYVVSVYLCEKSSIISVANACCFFFFNIYIFQLSIAVHWSGVQSILAGLYSDNRGLILFYVWGWSTDMYYLSH